MNGASRRSMTGIPPELARVPFGVIRPADAASVYAHPRTQVARLVERGLLHPLASGYYALVPRALVGADFRPTLEAAAYGVAASSYGADEELLMGLSAARMHGAVPRALSVAVVAVPAVAVADLEQDAFVRIHQRLEPFLDFPRRHGIPSVAPVEHRRVHALSTP